MIKIERDVGKVVGQSFLVIEAGEPFQKGDIIKLTTQDVVIGRATKEYTPDICFNSLYISRRHAQISFLNNGFYIKDLESTHGTAVNGQVLKPEQFYKLNPGDVITLIEGLVFFTYQEEVDPEKTIVFPQCLINRKGLFVDEAKKQIWYQDKILKISGKPRELLLLLYRNKNRTVSYEEIKRALWPERELDEDGLPIVGNEEIYALVYRLRKQLGGELEKMIITVSGYGVILELD